MNFLNILFVGVYVAFAVIFLYCYWGYTIYKESGTRIGMRATSKYYQEMVEADPNTAGYDVQKAQVEVAPNRKTATVKFNIYAGSPPNPVGGAMRVYTIVSDQKKCLIGKTNTENNAATCDYNNLYKDKPPRLNNCGDAECIKESGEWDQKMLAGCYDETTSGLGCLWL
jgi:hypothetical protein